MHMTTKTTLSAVQAVIEKKKPSRQAFCSRARTTLLLGALILGLPLVAQAGSPASATYFEGDASMGDYDLDSCGGTLLLDLEVTGLLPTNSAVLTVYGWDVDEEAGEVNHVLLNGHFLGQMSGANGIWNSTTFTVDPSWVQQGTNTITYDIDINNAGWCSKVDWIQLLIDGGGGVKAFIEDTAVQGWTNSGGTISLDTDVTVFAHEAGSYVLEANLISPDSNNLGSQTQSFSLNADERSARNFIFNYPASSPTGTYTIKASLFHATTLLQDSFYPFEFFHTQNVGVNLPPTVSLIGEQNIFQDQMLTIDFTVDDPEDGPNNLIISGTSSEQALITDGSISFSGSGMNRSVSMTPVGGAQGQTFITITVSDGSASAVRGFYVNVLDPSNSAPDLDSAQSPVLTTLVENQSSIPGNTVAEIVVDGSITDADGGAVEAIAILAADEANGTWEYFLAGGSSWMNVAPVSEQSALLLGPDDRVRFVPDAAYVGNASLSFAAWDRSSFNAGDFEDASSRGGSTPFSSVFDDANITVRDIGSPNGAPVLNAAASPSLSPISQDNVTSSGNSVAEVVVNGSITDPDGPAPESIAVTGADSSNGTWEYSLDGGPIGCPWDR